MKKTNRKQPKTRKNKAPKSAAPKKVTTGYFLVPFFITVIALAVESCLVFNQKTGFIGGLIYNIFIGCFGIAGYFIPAGALAIAFFFNSIAENKTMVYKCCMLAVFCSALAALNSLLSLDGLGSAPVSVTDYFVKGYSGEGGGVVGGLIGKLMSIAFGDVFAIILSIIICLIAVSLFIGNTKAGVWIYLKEMRMFGAEKTAVLKSPKKTPEKISSKEPDAGNVELRNVAPQVNVGQMSNVGMTNTPSVSGSYTVDPFRYGSEVSQSSTKNQTHSIDLRASKKKNEEIKDIYSEETEKEKEDTKAKQITVQTPIQNGRAYSPFADPFTKRSDFIKKEGGSEAKATGTVSASKAPSRAYSPFADPFTKRDEFLRQGNTASSGHDASAEKKVAEGMKLSGVYGTGVSGSQGSYVSHVNNTTLQGQYSEQASANRYTGQGDEDLQGRSVGHGSDASNNQYTGRGIDNLQGHYTAQNSADLQNWSAGQGGGLTNGGVAAQHTKENDTQNGQLSNTLSSASSLMQDGTNNTVAVGTASSQSQFNIIGVVPEKITGAFSIENNSSDYEKTTTEVGKKNETAAPWEQAIKNVSPLGTPKSTAYLSDDEYTEDVYDEGDDSEVSEAGEKQETTTIFNTGSFASAYADGYNSGKNSADRDIGGEKGTYRDHTEKFYPNYAYPSSVLLEQRSTETTVTEDDVIDVRNKLLGKLASFKIEASLVGYSAGPSITRYELAPGPGVTVKAITNRIDDIALELQSDGVRIATVPGKSVIGIEVPNKKVSVVSLRSLIENREFMESKSKITVCVGLTVTGKPIYMDIDDMPHVLIAGQTKSGKSVAINCMLLSLLYRTTPDEVQLILIDPKRVELNIYSKVPHLVMPVIDDPQRAAAALRWAVCEMERRYEMMDNLGVRNRDEYYELKEQDPTLEYLPQIVIVIDELADLMLQVREHVETLINRLAAKARACGIHLVVGTQRPSVDIVTGLIKANIPARISFQVSSSADSRIILGAVGAEKLLGRGDMLYQATGAGRVRVQGAFVSSSEIKRVTKFIIDNNGEAMFDPEIMRQLDVETDKINKTNKKTAADDADSGSYIDSSEADFENICKAMEYIFESGVTTTNNIQRRLRIGFNRAADIVDSLENLGFISRRNGSRPRDILIDPEQFEQWRLRNAP